MRVDRAAAAPAARARRARPGWSSSCVAAVAVGLEEARVVGEHVAAHAGLEVDHEPLEPRARPASSGSSRAARLDVASSERTVTTIVANMPATTIAIRLERDGHGQAEAAHAGTEGGCREPRGHRSVPSIGRNRPGLQSAAGAWSAHGLDRPPPLSTNEDPDRRRRAGHPTDGRGGGRAPRASGAAGRRRRRGLRRVPDVPARGGDHRLGDAGDRAGPSSPRGSGPPRPTTRTSWC